jgi:hypothetical protein
MGFVGNVLYSNGIAPSCENFLYELLLAIVQNKV